VVVVVVLGFEVPVLPPAEEPLVVLEPPPLPVAPAPPVPLRVPVESSELHAALLIATPAAIAGIAMKM
jgi:hypothetical protein